MVARRSRLGALAAALMCAVVLALGAPTPALADATYEASVTTSSGTTTNYEKLTSALSNAQDGDTVTLLENITITSSSTTTGYTVDKSITLDLGEKTISSSITTPLLTISGGSVTLQNGTMKSTSSSAGALAIKVNGATAKLTIASKANIEETASIGVGVNVASGSVVMTGGSINAAGNGIVLAGGTTATITGGSITAYWPIQLGSASTVSISGVISGGAVTSKPTFTPTGSTYNASNNPYGSLTVADDWKLVDESGNEIATTGEVTSAVTATVAYTGTLATDISNFTLSQTASLTYTGSALTPTYKLVDGSGDEVDSSKYDVTVYSDSACTSEVTEVKDAGTYYIKATAVSGSGYTGTTTTAASFTVAPKAVTISGVSAADKTYDGTTDATITGTPTLSDVASGDSVSVDSTNAKATFADKNVGANKTVTFSGFALTGTDAANYTLSAQPASTTASITQKKITVTIASIDDQTYTGSQITPTVSVSSNDLATGDTLTLGTDYTVSYGTNTTVAQGGTVSVSPVATSNYAFDTVGATFNITKADATVTTEPAATNPTYNGSAQALVSEGATSDGTIYYRLKTGDNTYTDWSTTVPTATNAGSYPVEYYVKGDANHNDSTAQTISASITKATYSGTISGSLAVATNTVATYTYDFASQLSGIDGVKIKSTENTSDPDNIINSFDGNNTTVTVTTKSVSGEGKTATIRVAFESTNYINFYAPLTLTAKNKGDAGVTLSGAPTSLTYGDADFTLTATAANTGANGTWTWTSSDPDTLQVTQDSSNPNKAVVKVLKANTTGTTVTASYSSDTTEGSAATASLVVGKKALTITGVLAADKTYDGTTDATITGTAALSGVLTGDTVSLDSTNASASFEDKNAGTDKTVTFSGYALTGADAANYTLTQPESVTATIEKATPTISTLPSAGAIDFGQTVGASALTGGEAQGVGGAALSGEFTWSSEDAGKIPTVVGDSGKTQYAVVFTPSDTNYTSTTGAVTITVNPSGTAPNAPSEYNPSYTVTTLAGVDLPAGWEWVDSSTALAVGEAVTAKAKYVGEDAGNYATTEVDVKVTRSACTHPANMQEVRNAKAATATEAGYAGDTYCTQCGELISRGSVIPATGESDNGTSSSVRPASSSGNAKLAATGDTTSGIAAAAAALTLAAAALACAGFITRRRTEPKRS